MPDELERQHPAEDVFGITHGVTREQAVGFAIAQLQVIKEAIATAQRLESVIGQKAIEETK